MDVNSPEHRRNMENFLKKQEHRKLYGVTSYKSETPRRPQGQLSAEDAKILMAGVPKPAKTFVATTPRVPVSAGASPQMLEHQKSLENKRKYSPSAYRSNKPSKNPKEKAPPVTTARKIAAKEEAGKKASGDGCSAKTEKPSTSVTVSTRASAKPNDAHLTAFDFLQQYVVEAKSDATPRPAVPNRTLTCAEAPKIGQSASLPAPSAALVPLLEKDKDEKVLQAEVKKVSKEEEEEVKVDSKWNTERLKQLYNKLVEKSVTLSPYVLAVLGGALLVSVDFNELANNLDDAWQTFLDKICTVEYVNYYN